MLGPVVAKLLHEAANTGMQLSIFGLLSTRDMRSEGFNLKHEK